MSNKAGVKNAKISFAEDMWVDAFKAGKHTDSAGNTRNWTADDLQKIATTYNETIDRKAPVVIGHPEANAPAYGWIESIRVVGDKLQAKLTELNDGFVEALKAGAYKMRSISLYPDLNVRHLGFLGAMQPAVAGLAPFKFEENDRSITYEFNEEDEMAEFTQDEVKALKRENSFFKKVFDLFKLDTQRAADHGETIVNVINGANTDTPVVPPVTPPVPEPMLPPIEEVPVPAPAFEDAPVEDVPPEDVPPEDEPAKDVPTFVDDPAKEVPPEDVPPEDEENPENFAEQIVSLKKELSVMTAERDSLRADAGETEVKTRVSKHREFCQALVNEGRMRPVELEHHVLNMELRYGADAGSFSETNKETASLNSYMEYLQAQPRVVVYEELVTKTAAADHAESSPDDKIVKLCDQKMAANKGMSYAQAFASVGKEYPTEMAEYINSQS